MPKATAKKLKVKYSDLAKDELCIYQAVQDMEGGEGPELCNIALQGGAKEVDDEAAMVVLAAHFGYDGPTFTTGSAFNKIKFVNGDKSLAICTGSHLKKCVAEASTKELAKALMDPANTSGVTFHAIGITIENGTRIIHDQQAVRSKGPFDRDDVIYWKKGASATSS